MRWNWWMICVWTAALSICALFGTLVATAAFGQTRTVTYDLGGPVIERIAQINAMTQRGYAVRIPHGRCMSACTLYLGLPDTCIGPTAVFGFHGPRAASGIALPRAEFDRISRAMAAHYPDPIAAWFMSSARFVTSDVLTVTGAQLIERGVMECQ